jgi:hypothetical protein
MRRQPNVSQREGTRGSGISASPMLPKRFLLARSSLEVDDQRYNAAQIRALYVSELYSLSRNKRAL